MTLHPPIDAPALFETFTVDCFFHGCAHVVREQAATAAHDLMEDHYREAHASEINRILEAS